MIIVLVFILVLSTVGAPKRSGTTYFDGPLPMVIAHQGGDGLRPGNTLLAFDHANRLGADVLEMDVHATRDGVLVLMHDETVDRTTNGSGRISEMDLSTLKTLDAAYHWPMDGEPRYRGKGVTVPTLVQVLERFPRQRFNIEIKQVAPSIVQPLCQLLHDQGVTGQVLVASFHSRTMAEFRNTCPDVATSAVSSEVSAFLLLNMIGLPGLHHPRAHALQVPEERYGIALTRADRVAAAGRLQLHVDIWTLNDEASIAAAYARGVGGVITDRPDLALKVRRSMQSVSALNSGDQ